VEDVLPRVAGAHSSKFKGVQGYQQVYYEVSSHLCVFCVGKGQPTMSGDELAKSPDTADANQATDDIRDNVNVVLRPAGFRSGVK